MAKRSFPKRVETKDTVTREGNNKYERVNVMKILADQYPADGADYAIHLWYKSHGHNPRFRVNEKFLNDDLETAMVVINEERWQINIRTAQMKRI